MLEKLFPCSFSQQRLWFLDQLEPGNPAYNLPRVIRVTGALDPSALRRAIEELVLRHESLRTVFTSVDGEPRQSVLPSIALELPMIDQGKCLGSEGLEVALRIASEEAQKPFDLASGPLLRATLIRLGREEHILVLVMHHIITDGWSMSVFFRELSELYTAYERGHRPELPQLTLRYTDFAEWQREHTTGEFLTSQIDYWKKKLDGAEFVLDLPTDRPRPAIPSGNGANEYFHIAKKTAEKLKSFSQGEE